MGNQICDAVSQQTQYRRTRISESIIPQVEGQNAKFNPVTSIKDQQSQYYPEQMQITYKGHLIKCRSQDVKFLKAQQGKKRLPLINGVVKLYKDLTDSQLLFQGQLKNSRFHGFGKLYRQKQLIYEGEFKNNLFDGWGITPEYTGEFREGIYDGYGIYQEYQNYDRKIVTFYYEGYFQRGLYSGSGVLIKGTKWPVEKIQKIHEQEGIFDFINNQIEHGMSIFKHYGAKEIYIGQFSNGFRHGFGRLFNENMEFSGQFSHNLYHGLGTIYNNTSEGTKVIQTVFKMGKQMKN